MRGEPERPRGVASGAGHVGSLAPSRRLSAKSSICLWIDDPGPYLRAAGAAGLTGVLDFVASPLAGEPPDDVLARSDALLAWRPPRRLAERAPGLRWIHSLTVGAEQWVASSSFPSGAVLTCARGAHRLQMPENILGALFLVQKQLAGIVLDQRERRWRRRVNQTLAGKTLGILGLGTIGRELARKAGALEMRVIGTTRSGAPAPGAERVWGPDGTEEVLAAADFVVLLLPSTPATRGLINRDRLARMRPTAYLLNFGRGDLVVDEDLVDAVRRGIVAGAVLDVFRTEPLPAESPLWGTDGIVVLPHIGGLHPERDTIVAELWVQNLRRFVAGEPLANQVDRARGY